ncbi:Calx-beta domain-containing protein [Azospirillum sp.]|uniref:Calx-beta domain-containing protein n=1 Tax=Azospirillum sp. TaxID=34012 RepID=UPI003D74B920
MIVQGTSSNDPNLVGTAERDEIYGGAGNDTIIGGAGHDYMEGGAGSDVFVLRPGDGWDCIGDFQQGYQGADTLDLSAFTWITSRADLNALATADGNDVVLTFSPDTSVRLSNVSYSAFTNGPLSLKLHAAEEPAPAQSFSVQTTDVRQAEGSGGGSTEFAFTVVRTGDLSQAASVNWGTLGVYARNGEYGMASPADFAAGQPTGNGGMPGGVLTFAAGQASATIRVGVLGDNAVETAEGFKVYLSTPSAGWTIDPAHSEGLGVILNDDASGNTLTGTADRDVLFGTASNDTIIGGGGNDYMEGGAGADTFVFGPEQGWDYIGDFQAGAGGDVLDLRGLAGVHAMGDLTLSAEGGDTTIAFSDTASVRLAGVSAGQLTASNFLFA